MRAVGGAAMLERLKTVCLLVAACLPILSGCGAFRCGCGDGCRHKSPYAGMQYDCCCETCGPNCGPSCGHSNCCCGTACRGCGQECGCGSPDDCGGSVDGSCGKRRHKWRLFGMFDCAGCGGCYWNEWYNDPPAQCEPCDCCGNYTGPYATCCCQTPCQYQADYSAMGPTALPPLEEAPPAAPTEKEAAEFDASALGAETE